MHLLTLHTHGSSNPLGISSNADKLPMHPYFIFKDLVTILLFFLALSVIVFYLPNLLGHSDNYIPANPMQTPPSINNFLTFAWVDSILAVIVNVLRAYAITFVYVSALVYCLARSHFKEWLSLCNITATMFIYVAIWLTKLCLVLSLLIIKYVCTLLARSLYLVYLVVIGLLTPLRLIISSIRNYCTTVVSEDESSNPESESKPGSEGSGLFNRNGKIITLTASELGALLFEECNSMIGTLIANPLTSVEALSFQQLTNGVIQAEGHRGGYFTNIHSLTFRPMFYISQNAS